MSHLATATGVRSWRIGLLLLLAAASIAAALLVGSQYASAGAGPGPIAPPGAAGAPDSAAVVLANRKLKSTTIVHDSGSQDIPPGAFTAMHPPVTLNCPNNPGTCTISAEMHTQFYTTDASGQGWSTCLFVDGVLAQEPLCPSFNTETIEDEFEVRTFSQNVTAVGRGTHTVQARIFANAPGGVRKVFDINYRVYTP